MEFKTNVDKLKAWYDIEYKNICPKCKEKEMWLDEDGMEHQSYVCKSCGIEAYVQLERIPERVHLYEEDTDTETLLFDDSDKDNQGN